MILKNRKIAIKASVSVTVFILCTLFLTGGGGRESSFGQSGNLDYLD